MGEIYEFPRNKQITKPLTSNDLTESIEQFRIGYIDDISEFLINILISEISRGGFEINDEDTDDIMLMVESIRSLMMKKSGFDHPLQEVAQNMKMSFSDETEEDGEQQV